VNVRVVDETDFGFGWIEATAYGRTSHALAADGRVWVLDPFEADGVDEKIRALGEPAGVVLLLDRHRRDGEAFAARLGAPSSCCRSAATASGTRSRSGGPSVGCSRAATSSAPSPSSAPEASRWVCTRSCACVRRARCAGSASSGSGSATARG
jgi:hypothetical protein